MPRLVIHRRSDCQYGPLRQSLPTQLSNALASPHADKLMVARTVRIEAHTHHQHPELLVVHDDHGSAGV